MVLLMESHFNPSGSNNPSDEIVPQIINISTYTISAMIKRAPPVPRLKRDEYYQPPIIETRFDVLTQDNIISSGMLRVPFPDPPLIHERMFVETDFPRVEKRRIQDVSDWHRSFMAAGNMQRMGEVILYTVQPKFPPSIQYLIGQWGYFPIGLSAVKLSANCFVHGLVAPGIKVPPYSRLIRVTSSQKIFRIFNTNSGIPIPFLIIEDWHDEPEISVFSGFHYEKGLLTKILSENFYAEQNIIDGIVAPIVSSPPYQGVGGISSSSFAGQQAFTKEFYRMIQIITPPPFRQYLPPARAERGWLEEIESGLTYKFADRPRQDREIVTTIHSPRYAEIAQYVLKRYQTHVPEYSIFSTILHPYQEPQRALYDLLSHYSDSEITITEDLDLLPEGGADIKRTTAEITEEVFFEIANKRNIIPVPTESTTFIEGQVDNLLQHYHILLIEQLGKKHEYIATDFLPRIGKNVADNFARVSQHIARNNEHQQIDDDTFYAARKIMKTQYERLIDSVHVKDMISTILEDCKDDTRLLSANEKQVKTKIMNFLKDNPKSSFDEIHDGIHYETISSDPEKLHRLLDKLANLGHLIYFASSGTFLWV